MRAALELQPRVRAVPRDLDDRLLDAADARLAEAHDLGLVPAVCRVAQVHLEELVREQRGLLAARARPDLQDHVAVVGRIAREQEHLQLVHERGLALLQLRDLLAGHSADLLVGLGVAQPARAGQLVAGRAEAAVRLDDGLEPGDLQAESLQGIRVARRLGEHQLGVEVVVLAGDLVELRVERRWGGHRGRLVARRVARCIERRVARRIRRERRPDRWRGARARAAPTRPGCPRRPPRGPAPSTRSRPRSGRPTAASS